MRRQGFKNADGDSPMGFGVGAPRGAMSESNVPIHSSQVSEDGGIGNSAQAAVIKTEEAKKLALTIALQKEEQKAKYIKYGLFGLGGILVITTGIILYRKFKKKH